MYHKEDEIVEREKFMKEARMYAHQILEGKENGIMNLVQRAWAEGKRNAEVETLRAAIDEALDRRESKADPMDIKPKTTWGEFLCNIGLIHDCTEPEEVVLRLFDNVIPADIAEKLGVPPKPIDYCEEAYRSEDGTMRIRKTPIYPIEPKEDA